MSTRCTCLYPCKNPNVVPLDSSLQEEVTLGRAAPEGEVPQIVLLPFHWPAVLEVNACPAGQLSDVAVLSDGEGIVLAVWWVLLGNICMTSRSAIHIQ